MTDTHPYTEDEIAEMFRLATDEARRSIGAGDRVGGPGSHGLTLRELQEIGEQVGIDRDLVARSAAALRHGADEGQVTQRVVGAPLGLSRTTALPRRLRDEEWDRIVLDLRETFDARGRIGRQGELREWTNGNLQAFLEPTPDGERFRIRTRKGAGEVPVIGGLIMMVFAVLVGVITLATGDPLAEVLRQSGVLMLVGGMGFGVGAVSLQRWSRERQAQMAAVSDRVARLAGVTPPDDSTAPSDSHRD